MGGKDLKYPHLYEDGLHPTDEGYRVMARTVYCHLQSCEDGWEATLQEEAAQANEKAMPEEAREMEGEDMDEDMEEMEEITVRVGEDGYLIVDSAVKLATSIASLAAGFYML
jgi:hypothetical protein